MQLATSVVKFSFNNIMLEQIDSIAIGSPPGQNFANFYIGYQGMKVFNNKTMRLANFHKVDTFSVFSNKEECENFLTHINSFHSSLSFTHEKEPPIASSSFFMLY